MKILAIRGSNLASLDGEFSIDFTTPNLAQNGLIAITGSTGAGKSTLLDALCLALFNRIPRLPSRSSSQILIGRTDEDDKQRLASHDVRHILRRGTGEGYAEVDFLGVDHKKYRATWTIRRARRRPDGRFQTPEHLLICLQNEKPIGRTRTEVEQFIIDRLGLSFDQFRRSVLLAQGDFASFLKADAPTRSRLLEMITGTEIYGEISRLAHQRANVESKALEQLQIRLNEYDTLDDKAKESLKSNLTEQEIQLEKQKITREQWQQQEEKLKQLKVHQQQLKQIQVDYKKQKEAWQGTQISRDELQQIKQLQNLRLPLQRFDDAESAYKKNQLQIPLSKKQLQKDEALLEQFINTLNKQKSAYQYAEQQLKEAQPNLRLAYQLDSDLRQAATSLQALKTEQNASQHNVKQLKILTHTQQDKLQEAQQTLESINNWLGQNQADELLSSQWIHWQSLFADGLSKQQLEKSNTLQLNKLQQVQAKQAAQLEQSQKAIHTKQHQLGIYKQSLSALDEQNIQLQLEQCIADIQSFHNELIQLKELEKHQQQLTKNHDGQASIEQELNQLQNMIQQAEQEKQQAEAALVIQDATLNGAIQVHTRALLATGQSVEQLRTELTNGSPCSVCGSIKHPWQGNTQLQSLAEAQNKIVQQLQAENNELKRSQQQAISDIHFHQIQKNKQISALEDLQKQSLVLLDQWQCLSSLTVETFKATETITKLQKQIRKQQLEQSHLNTQRKQVENLRQQKDLCIKELDEHKNKQQSLEISVQKNYQDTQYLQQQIIALQADFLSIWKSLEKVVSYLIQENDISSIDLSSLKAHCQKHVRQYQQQKKHQDDLDKEISQIHSSLEKDLIENKHAKKNLQQLDLQLQKSHKNIESLQQSRQTLFLDYTEQSTEQIEKTLNQYLQETRKSHEKGQQQRQIQSEKVLSKKTQLLDLQKHNDELKSQHQKHANTLKKSLLSFEITETVARKKLDQNEAWIQQQELKFEKLKQALQTSKVHLMAARQALQNAPQTKLELQARVVKSPKIRLNQLDYLQVYNDIFLSDNKSFIQQQLQHCKHALDTYQTHVNELSYQLRDDNNKCKRAKKLQKFYNKQDKVTHLWKVMKELIGSSSGAKFRNFAQSLTLEILLSHTNQRLQELNRRYALQRVPQTDLELQIIDKEMGDEIRPVHSLSGGESFLVSLALALGLASLSSRKTQIDSLFIDEGFGTLDPQTLDTALSALDSLQSQGKTVCIISHVSAITERVSAQIRVKTCGGGRSIIEKM